MAPQSRTGRHGLRLPHGSHLLERPGLSGLAIRRPIQQNTWQMCLRPAAACNSTMQTSCRISDKIYRTPMQNTVPICLTHFLPGSRWYRRSCSGRGAAISIAIWHFTTSPAAPAVTEARQMLTATPTEM